MTLEYKVINPNRVQTKHLTKCVLFTLQVQKKNLRLGKKQHRKKNLKTKQDFTLYQMQTKSFVSFPLGGQISAMDQNDNELQKISYPLQDSTAYVCYSKIEM